jgi:hypothetical protein
MIRSVLTPSEINASLYLTPGLGRGKGPLISLHSYAKYVFQIDPNPSEDSPAVSLTL